MSIPQLITPEELEGFEAATVLDVRNLVELDGSYAGWATWQQTQESVARA